MTGFDFEENIGYSVVRFKTDLHEMSWGDVENEASEIVEKLKSANMSRIIVDLSPMELIQSGLVASLVRMWKATEGYKNRKLVIETANEVVRNVIRTAGLLKVFTVVSTREEAVYEVGGSKSTRTEQRERHVIAWVALPAALLAIVTLFPIFYMKDMSVKGNAELAGLLLAASAFMASLFSIAKDKGWRKGLGAIAMILALIFFAGLSMSHNSSHLRSVEQNTPDDDLSESTTADPANTEETADGEDDTPTEDETDKPSESDSEDD